MKSLSLHSLLFFLPDEISRETIYNIIVGGLCIILVFSLIALYRRVRYGYVYGYGYLEGMTNAIIPTPTPKLDPAVEDLKKQVGIMNTVYSNLKNGIDDQTNRVNANAQMLMKSMGDTPNQTNDITHANVNTDDPSKTRIPRINT